MNRRIFSIALVSLMTIVGVQAMQQAVTKEMCIIKINNKTDKNYVITTSQELDSKTHKMVPAKKNANPVHTEMKAGDSKDILLALDELDPKLLIPGVHRHERQLFVSQPSSKKGILRISITQDKDDTYLDASFRANLFLIDEAPSAKYRYLESTSLERKSSQKSKDISFFSIINLQGEDLEESKFSNISASQK